MSSSRSTRNWLVQRAGRQSGRFSGVAVAVALLISQTNEYRKFTLVTACADAGCCTRSFANMDDTGLDHSVRQHEIDKKGQGMRDNERYWPQGASETARAGWGALAGAGDGHDDNGRRRAAAEAGRRQKKRKRGNKTQRK